MPRYQIAPGETIDYTFDFNGPNPGPALQAGQTVSGRTVTVTGGLTLVSDAISGGTKVIARISCPSSMPLGRRCQLRCVATTAGTSAGEVLVDQIDITVSF